MKILITGAGSVMGQSICKALSMYNFGEKLEIVFANSEFICSGFNFAQKGYPIVDCVVFPLASDEKYIDFLKSYVYENDISIVFSGTQHELDKISGLRNSDIKVATIPHNIAQICLDKLKTCDILTKYGIRAPQTYSLRNYIDSEKIKGSVLVKPNTSSASRNILRFDNRESCLLYFDNNKTINVEQYIVQSLLKGQEITCGCYIDRYSKKISTICLERTLTADGATFYGKIINNKAISEYIFQVASALIAEGLDFGHINIQLIIDENGPCLFEINGRLSSTEAPKAHFGFNSSAAFVVNLVQEREFQGWKINSEGSFIRYYEEVYF